MLVDQSDWEQIVSKMGVENEDEIVIYDNSDVISSCRCWFNFIYFGHNPKLVHVLNGGLKKWIKENNEVTKNIINIQPSNYKSFEKKELVKNKKSINQNINIRLDANVTNLNWDFSPEKNIYKIKIGENKVINYLAQNLSNEKQVGTALFNVTPEQAGQYFTKIECFCFHDLMLEPGEEIKLPVSFYIDPEIIDDQFLKDLSEVTLSYTFYKNADTPIS